MPGHPHVAPGSNDDGAGAAGRSPAVRRIHHASCGGSLRAAGRRSPSCSQAAPVAIRGIGPWSPRTSHAPHRLLAPATRGTALGGPRRDPGQFSPSARRGRLLRKARGLPRGRGRDPIERRFRNLTMTANSPTPVDTFQRNPVLRDVMGETARGQARLGKLTGWLARRYAGVWPTRGDDLPGELWRPIPRRRVGEAGVRRRGPGVTTRPLPAGWAAPRRSALVAGNPRAGREHADSQYNYA